LQRHVPAIPEAIPSRAALIGAGQAALRSGSPDAAEQAFVRALRRFPDAHAAYIGLGRVALARGDAVKARLCAEKYLASADPGNFGALMLLAEAALEMLDFAAADYAFAAAETHGRAEQGYYLRRADMALLRGDLGAEIAILEQGLDRAAVTFRIRLRLARCRSWLGDADAATAVLDALDPGAMTDTQRYWAACMYAQCGRADAAGAMLDRVDPDGGHASARLLADVMGGATDAATAVRRIRAAKGPRDAAYEVLLAMMTRSASAAGRDEARGLVEADAGVTGRRLTDRSPADLRGRYALARDYFAPGREADDAAAPLVSILCPIHRAEDRPNLLRQIARQRYPRLEAIVIVNGPGIDPAALRAELARMALVRGEALECPAAMPLAAVLNAGTRAARGDYICRFDADDLYLDRYVANTVRFMRAQQADICGKADLFIRMEALGCTLLRSDPGRPYSIRPGGLRHGSGSSTFVRRAVAEAVPHDETVLLGEDVQFYMGAQARGFDMVCAPPFDHIVIRQADKARHTWKVADLELLHHATVVAAGPVAEDPFAAPSGNP